MVEAAVWFRELKYILSNTEEICGYGDALYQENAESVVDGGKDEPRSDTSVGYF